MKSHRSRILSACLCLTTASLLGQSPGPEPLTGAQILPFLKRQDLKGLAALVHKTFGKNEDEVTMSLDDAAWNHVPFNRLLVSLDYTALKTKDDIYYVLGLFPPPALEKLQAARTYQEVLQLLVPPSRPEGEAMLPLMDVPVSKQCLEETKIGYDLSLRAAYFHENRIVWIDCTMTYGESQGPRSLSTPFYESVIQIHVSPKYK